MKRRLGSVGLIMAIAMTLISGWAAAKPGVDIAPGVEGSITQQLEALPASEYPGYHEVNPLALLDIWLYVPYFDQCDTLWADDIMETCGKTICSKGCALTSTAMVLKYYGSSKNPQQLNTCLGEDACDLVWAAAADRCSENHATFINLYGYSLSLLVSALEDGRPPIVRFYNASTGRQHWVVVKAVRGTGTLDSEFYINDPNGGVQKKISDYTSAGYKGTTVAIYARR